MFSHPADFTPVCTTELGEVARRQPDFAKRNVKVIGLSANELTDHHKWLQDINDYGAKIGPTNVEFPIVSPTIVLKKFVSVELVYRLQTRTGRSPGFTTCLTHRMRPTSMQRAFLSP